MTILLARPATLMTVSTNLLRARDNIQMQRLWVSVAIQVLDLYIVKIEVCLCSLPSIFVPDI